MARLTKAQRMRERVKVAKDVLASLAAKRFKAKRGTYCDLGAGIVFEPKAQLNQAVRKLKTKPCACAMGALFLARLDKKNAITMRQAWPYEPVEPVDWIADETIVRYLRDIYPEDELRRIEQAFEQGPGLESEHGVYRRDGAWGDGYPNPAKRLRAICENIIRHKGEFDYEDVG